MKTGVHFGIATGRGKSVRAILQACIPKRLWSLVFIGYYNGAEVASLCDNGAPDGVNQQCDRLAPMARALRAQPEITEIAKQTDRRFQITLEAKHAVLLNQLWHLTNETLLLSGFSDVALTQSCHSVDILAPGVSKVNILTRLHEHIGDKEVLRIGDQGRWPGNDFELLKDRFALSVDQTNIDPKTCWNLGPRGQRGKVVTLSYLAALKASGAAFRFQRRALL